MVSGPKAIHQGAPPPKCLEQNAGGSLLGAMDSFPLEILLEILCARRAKRN
jgi:hypothetical protein